MRTVRAAGGVVWRLPEGKDAPVVAVVHRPKYDDWSLPKGKLDDGENDEVAAVREIQEETGQDAVIVSDLGEIHYEATKNGETFAKVVRFFEMRVDDVGHFEPNDEVDELRWLPPAELLDLLSYDRDRDVLRRYDDR
jgi:8-oxo-dGTP diphosphatase